MAIRIRKAPFERTGANPGPYPMKPDEVLAQLGVIAMAGSPELPGTLGDSPDPADGDFSVISYDPGPQDVTTPAGRVRQRLKDLVDSGKDIKLFGVGPDFLWSDGSTIEDSAGGAIGDWIFYDTQNCDGDGRWVRGTDGEEVCVSSAGILYHELGHVFLDHPAGTVDDDERAAVEFENDLRTAEARVPRDPDRWAESECECPGDCCIVASVATGSPLSAEVHALRRFRDRTLRRTTVGMRFFDVLHHEYYRFSVAVSRILVTSPGAREHVAAWLVRPLVRALELARQYAREPGNEDRLGQLASVDCVAQALPQSLTWTDVRQALERTAAGEPLPPGAPLLKPAIADVFAILRDTLPGCPHVRWGIVEMLRIYADAQQRMEHGDDVSHIGRFLREAFDDWTASLPLQFIGDRVTSAEWSNDLPELADTFFTSALARRRFGERFAAAVSHKIDKRLEETLRREGFLQ